VFEKDCRKEFPPSAKHVGEGSAELQISPLRFAPVEMTKGRVALPLKFDTGNQEVFSFPSEGRRWKKAFLVSYHGC
jgi:hypothetical protein